MGDIIHHINIPTVNTPMITSHRCQKPPDKIQHTSLIETQIKMHNLQNADEVWGEYLYLNGFRRGVLPSPCPNCVTVKEFCRIHPRGTFVVATGYHVIAVIDGNYYDTQDTGDEVLAYYWEKEQ